jgi:hypothetical protein
VVANPRLPADIVERDSPALLDDAIGLPYDEFERLVRTWEALANPDGDRTRSPGATPTTRSAGKPTERPFRETAVGSAMVTTTSRTTGSASTATTSVSGT